MELCFGIKNQTAIITGASSGLGVTFAEALAEAGANVVLAARRFDRLKEVAEEISKNSNVGALPVETDVTKEDQVVNMVQKAIKEFGSIEILVKNE
jgi:gluconate 5-dehydrogenase